MSAQLWTPGGSATGGVAGALHACHLDGWSGIRLLLVAIHMHHDPWSLLAFNSTLAVQAAQPQSKEEALRSMQSYRAGLSQALAKHEDQLKAQASPSEGVIKYTFCTSLSSHGFCCGNSVCMGLQACVPA